MNTGYITSFDNRYNITVFDAQDDQVHGETVVDKVDFQPGETVTREVSIAPYQPLPAGVYKIVLTCFDPCDTDAEPVTGYFPVVPMTYRLSGLVQGEDGVPINKGKLFLYRKESNGQIRFTQKTDPFQGPTFSFNIDTDPYTLYFIPDPVQYPGYAPTIYGKTVTLESSNFFTTTQDKDVVMEVLKLQPLASGAGVISGRLASGEQSSGRQPASVEAAGVPVMLLSSTGEVVAITYTDASGNFEFTNLPRDNYQILAAFELDATVQMEPYAVDIVTKNARVDLVQTPDGIEPEVSPLILPQILTFNVFATHRYGDAAITLDAQTDARLPITYSSSDERVATIMDGKAVIHSAGEVTISASQAGDDFYHPATTITRPLTIHKGLQSITFEAPAYLLSVASSFTLQAAASSGLPISFESSDESIVSIKGNSATAYKDGVVTITARQPGNPNYEAAADVAHEWIVQVTTAIEPGMEGKKLYPNPTTGIVFIDMPGVRQVEVSDVTGRVQNQASWQGQTLDLSLTPAGLYTIKLTLSNRTVVTKVFKR
jgi:hypothetical protein